MAAGIGKPDANFCIFINPPSDIACGHLSFLIYKIERVVNIYSVLTKAGRSNH